MLIFQNQKYLFNCFEGFQRYSIESKVKLSQISTVFLPTSMSIIPFIGTFLTIGDTGKNNINIVTHHKDIFLSAKPFAERKKLKTVFYDARYSDNNIECDIFVINECSNVYLKIKNIRGKFNESKATENKIPKKQWKCLCEGKEIEHDGKKYYGKDFLEPDNVFEEICILYNNDIEESDVLKIKDCKIYICFSQKVYNKISQTKSAEFYVLNDMNYVEYKSLYNLQMEMNKIYSNFRCIQVNNSKADMHYNTNANKRMKHANNATFLESCDTIKISPQIAKYEVTKALQEEHSYSTHKNEHKYTDGIYFLGTGSAIPSKYRNVSSILVINKASAIFLDCGEDTLYNVLRIFGSIEILQKVDAIYISHSHPDHHLGAISLIHQILTMRTSVNVIGPKITCDFIKQYCTKGVVFYFTDTNKRPQQQYNAHLMKLDDYKTTYDFGYKITTCPVNHTVDSYGVRVDFSDISISYSGDCRPSFLFEKLSNSVDVMIHEATFADELHTKALQTKHSTITEAVGIYKNSNAKTLILTHFSQRYPKKIDIKNVICAFDFFVYDFFDHNIDKTQEVMDYLAKL